MKLHSLSLVAVLASFATSRPAEACTVPFTTPYDLFDEAAIVAVVKVVAVGKTATLTVTATLKGTSAAKTINAGLGMCSPRYDKLDGREGVVFLDGTGGLLGAYAGFVTDRPVIAALRVYGSASSAAPRAKALIEIAVSNAWTPSFEAAYALADRVELIDAMDASTRERVIARLATVGEQHTLIRVASRLHDPRVRPIHQRRKFEDVDALAGVLADRFERETDPAKLADTMAAKTTSDVDRIAAFERCERLQKRSLARLNDYMDLSDPADWPARSSACRTGKRIVAP